jgi:tRNA (adenine37-N6)-methyltransferase
LGLSLCRMEGVEDSGDGPELLLGGVDMIDGTPVYDIKPYVAYAEAIPDAACGYAGEAPATLGVELSEGAMADFFRLPERDQRIIREALAQDPRPAVHDDADRLYGARICGKNVRFRVGERVVIEEIAPDF